MVNTSYEAFQDTVWTYYDAHGRHDLPWRLPDPDGSFNPYHVLVSEVMLQQTQVARVITKYQAFLQAFPTAQVLAAAPLGTVLIAWQGLGYNRRAKFLWEAARIISDTHQGIFPHTQSGLDALPGVGINTAGALMAYVYNTPVVFIETNIRTVFIHHFFHDRQHVTDKDITALVAATLPGHSRIREWYWALMDYGTYLKQSIGNLSRASSAYVKQSTFHGSARQLRGQVLRLLAHQPTSIAALYDELADDRAPAVLAGLEAEGLIRLNVDRYELP